MHRALVAALALTLGACSARLPVQPQPLQHASLKDPTIKPDVPPSTVVRLMPADTSVAPVTVDGGSPQENQRLALAMFHGLNLAGHDIKRNGAWRVSGTIEGAAVIWTVQDPNGDLAGTVRQAGTTDPAVAAIVPGVRHYLPRPSTNL